MCDWFESELGYFIDMKFLIVKIIFLFLRNGVCGFFFGEVVGLDFINFFVYLCGIGNLSEWFEYVD